MLKKSKSLDFITLIPLYNGNVFDEIYVQAHVYGKKSLSKDERVFLKKFDRLDNYLSLLSENDYNELVNAVNVGDMNIISKHQALELKKE